MLKCMTSAWYCGWRDECRQVLRTCCISDITFMYVYSLYTHIGERMSGGSTGGSFTGSLWNLKMMTSCFCAKCFKCSLCLLALASDTSNMHAWVMSKYCEPCLSRQIRCAEKLTILVSARSFAFLWKNFCWCLCSNNSKTLITRHWGTGLQICTECTLSSGCVQ